MVALICMVAAPVTAAPLPNQPPPLELSLTEAVVLAMRQNRDVANAYRDRVVQKFALAVAEDTFTPIGRLTGGAAKSDNGGTDSESVSLTPTINWKVPTGAELTLSWAESISRDAAGSSSSFTRTIAVTQPLLRGAGTTVATAPVVLARNDEKINVESLRTTLAGTVGSVVQAYRSLLQARAALEIDRRSLARSRKLVEINRVLIDSGRMARQELVQAEADVAAREVSLASAENALDNARLTLLGLLALDKYTAVDPVEFVKEHTEGRGADVVYFAIAISKAFPQCMEMLNTGGRIICYSSQHPNEPVSLDIHKHHYSQQEIIGTVGSTAADFTRAAQLLNDKKLNMDLVIDHVLPYDDYKDAFEKSIVPGTYRVVMKTK